MFGCSKYIQEIRANPTFKKVIITIEFCWIRFFTFNIEHQNNKINTA